MNRLLLSVGTVALAAFCATGSLPAQAADAPATSIESAALGFESETARLLATHAEGGAALEDALVALIRDQPDQAAAVSGLIAQLGARPTPGQIAAAGNAIRRAAHFTPEELQQAISQLVALADDPAMMAMNIMAVSPYLEDDAQAALGLALAKATTLLREGGKPDAAGVIEAEIATAKDSPLQRAYLIEQGEDPLVTSSTSEAPKKNAVAAPIDFEPQTASPN